MATSKRKKQVLTHTFDPKLIQRLKEWISRQEIIPAQNAVIARAIEEFLDRRETRPTTVADYLAEPPRDVLGGPQLVCCNCGCGPLVHASPPLCADCYGRTNRSTTALGESVTIAVATLREGEAIVKGSKGGACKPSAPSGGKGGSGGGYPTGKSSTGKKK